MNRAPYHPRRILPVADQSSRKNRPCIELLDEAVVDVLRRKTPTERVSMIFAANRTMRLRLEGHLRTRHPDWGSQTVMQEVARRMSRGTG